MKIIFKTFFILTILTFVVLSCQDESTQATAENNILSIDEIETLALQHNKALEQTLFHLKESEITAIKDPVEMKELLNETLSIQYELEFDSENLVDAKAYSEKEVSKFFSRTNNNSRTSGMTPIEIVIDEARNELSDQQIQLLLEIDAILNNTSNDINTALEALNDLEDRATNTLSANKAQIILIGAEVGKASISYWNDNIDDWDKVLNSDVNGRTARTEDWFSWGDVGGADVAGAVGGAVVAVVVNVVPGLGQASYAGAIVGGAAGSSAANAVTQVWNHFLKDDE